MTTTQATHMTPNLPKPKFVTFDLYGTLTHFQMSARTRTLFSDRVPDGRMDEFLDDFEAYRFDEVLGAYKYYTDVIKDALRRTCARWSLEYLESDGKDIAWDVPSWGPHPDVSEPLARIAEHYPLVILSNAADVQIQHNVDKLRAPFHAVFTAEQARAYKPRFQAFEYMLEKLGCRRDEVLHVSSSMRYDIIPAHDLRIPHKVYVNRGYEPSVPYFQYHEMSDLSGLPSLLGV